MKTACFAMLFAAISPLLARSYDEAWWVDARFVPSEQTIEGIPIRQLDRSWAAASPLRESALPKEASVPGDTLKDNNAAFQMDGDVNHDGRPDRLLVGVYRTTSGKTGEFLLILMRKPNGQWTKAKLFKNEGKAGFSALFNFPDRILWGFCFECDVSCILNPSRSGWKLDCDTEPDV